MITFKEYLLETKLSIAELEKKANSGSKPFGGEERISILKKLIDKDQFNDLKLTLNSGEDIDLDFDNPALHTLSHLLKDEMSSSDWDNLRKFFKDNKPFKTVDGKEYKLSDLKKNAIFGSSKGSGGGAENTKLNESLQCVIGAIAATLDDEIKESDITIDAIKDVKDQYDNDLKQSPEKIFDDIFRDKSWTKSYITTANIIQQSKFNLTSSSIFHRQSSWVNELYDQAKKLFKDIKDLPFTDPNKWNPSDMWITNGDIKIPKFETLPELNNWLLEEFNKRDVIGVSLKKVSGGKMSIKNIDDEVDKLNDFDVVNLVLAKGKNPFSSKDAYIEFDDAKIQFRTDTSNVANIQGELQGKSAAHGKAGFGTIQGVLKFLKLDQLDTQKELNNLIDKDEKDDHKKFNEIFNKIKDYILPLLKDDDKSISEDELENLFYSNDKLAAGWIISKCQAAQLLHILRKEDLQVQKNFIINLNAIISSEHEYSSVHIKVS